MNVVTATGMVVVSRAGGARVSEDGLDGQSGSGHNSTLMR